MNIQKGQKEIVKSKDRQAHDQQNEMKDIHRTHSTTLKTKAGETRTLQKQGMFYFSDVCLFVLAGMCLFVSPAYLWNIDRLSLILYVKLYELDNDNKLYF